MLTNKNTIIKEREQEQITYSCKENTEKRTQKHNYLEFILKFIMNMRPLKQLDVKGSLRGSY